MPATTPRARLEDPPRLGIDDQIEVALPVARLDVGQAVPLLRQRQQALGEERRSRAQIVSSLVRVRKMRPSTPTWSPKSSSLKTRKLRASSESSRT